METKCEAHSGRSTVPFFVSSWIFFVHAAVVRIDYLCAVASPKVIQFITCQ